MESGVSVKIGGGRSLCKGARDGVRAQKGAESRGNSQLIARKHSPPRLCR